MTVIRPLLERASERRAVTLPAGRFLNIGHRGAAGDAPENTLAAFQLAIAQGADGIEFDVRLSSDRVPVVIHDARVDRTTNGRGLVSQFTAAALQRLDAGSWFNRRYPGRASRRFGGLHVLTLAEVLAWARKRECLAFLEVKARSKLSTSIEERILEAIREAKAAALVTVISFNVALLRRLRQLDPEVALGIGLNRPAPVLRRAASVGACAVLPHWALATRRFTHRAHAARLKVIVWTVNHPRAIERALLRGVDGIITDCPGRLAGIGEARLKEEGNPFPDER